MSETGDINTQLDKRAQTLRSLFSTKDVLPENQEVRFLRAIDPLVRLLPSCRADPAVLLSLLLLGLSLGARRSGCRVMCYLKEVLR